MAAELTVFAPAIVAAVPNAGNAVIMVIASTAPSFLIIYILLT
jgi:hypothetical protein